MDQFSYTISDKYNERPSCIPIPTYKEVRSRRSFLVPQLYVMHDANLMRMSAVLGLKKPKGVVYIAVNKLNSKLYVGKTIGSLSSRKYAHVKSALQGSGAYFHAAIRKYGPESFDFLVFAYSLDNSRLIEYEKRAIASILPEYNLTPGGEGKGWKKSPTYVSPILKNTFALGYKHTTEARAKMKGNKNGVGNKSRKGQHPSLEERKKLSVAQTQRWARKNKRFIECVDDKKIFNTIKAAATFYNINPCRLYDFIELGRYQRSTLDGKTFRVVAPK